MTSGKEALIVVLACRPGKKAQARIEHRIAEGKCLECDLGAPKKRGLCSSCYERYYSAAAGLSAVARGKFDAELIRLGYLLPAYGIREYRKKTIWQRVLSATKRA